jgi:tetratricopeptide (TPR) repeat protein
MNCHSLLSISKSTNVRLIFVLLSLLAGATVGTHVAAQSLMQELPRVPVVSASEIALRDGSRHAAAGDWEGASRAFNDAVRADPSSPLARYNLGVALVALGRRDEALHAYAEALRRDPNLTEARVNLGVESWKAGRHADALAHLTRAVRRAPHLSAAHHNLGVVLSGLGSYDEAARSLGRAAALTPGDPLIRQALAETHYNHGVALARDGRLRGAIVACRAALSVRPDLAPARTLLLSLQNGLVPRGDTRAAR